MLESGSLSVPLWKTKTKKKPQEIKNKVPSKRQREVQRPGCAGVLGSAQKVLTFRPPDLLGPSASGLWLAREWTVWGLELLTEV